MQSLGEILRESRESRGATASEAAEATKMKVQQIDALEQEAYDKIAAPIYVKGFLKLYAEYLGLDQDEVIRLYKANNAPLSPNELVGNKEDAKRAVRRPEKVGKHRVEEGDERGTSASTSAFAEMFKDLLDWIKSIRISGIFVRNILTVIGSLLVLLLIFSSIRSCVDRRRPREEVDDLTDIELIEPVPDPYIEPEHMPRG